MFENPFLEETTDTIQLPPNINITIATAFSKILTRTERLPDYKIIDFENLIEIWLCSKILFGFESKELIARRRQWININSFGDEITLNGIGNYNLELRTIRETINNSRQPLVGTLLIKMGAFVMARIRFRNPSSPVVIQQEGYISHQKFDQIMQAL